MRNSSENSAVDLLVVGGGIVGAGIARDAAMRGMKIMLVEQHDFSQGTSSRSSRLLHGGIRYLAQGKLALVFEASREKGVIYRIAPHLAQPLPFIFPTYKKTAWPKWQMAIGVRIYDLLCGKKNLGKSSNLSIPDLKRLLPQLGLKRSTGGVCYYDGLTNDSRLVMDTLASAAQNGAELRNHTRFIGAEYDGQDWLCELEDVASGMRRTIRCKSIVNATGVWSPELEQSKINLRPTKGVHLVIDRKRLEVPSAVVLTDVNRILFLIPWGDRIIVGTTDTDYSGSLEDPVCDVDDLEYVLNNVNAYFPEAKLEIADVLSTWAGLRPLVADSNGNPSDISRKHEITMSEPGWWDVTGGKLTTYRLIAEQVIDSVVKHQGRSLGKCATAKIPLIAGAPQETAHSGCLPPHVTREVVEYYVAHEWVSHLDDIMVRRTSWCHYLEDPLDAARLVVGWMAESLGWNLTKQAEELARYKVVHNQLRACLADEIQLTEEAV